MTLMFQDKRKTKVKFQIIFSSIKDMYAMYFKQKKTPSYLCFCRCGEFAFLASQRRRVLANFCFKPILIIRLVAVGNGVVVVVVVVRREGGC